MPARRLLALLVLAACGAPSPPPPTSSPEAPVAVAASPASNAVAPTDPVTTPPSRGALPSPRAAASMSLEEATAGPVTMGTTSLAPDQSMDLPASAEHEHLLLVLAGRVEIAPGNAPGARLGPWHAMRARGVAVKVTGITASKVVRVLVHGAGLPKRDVEVLDLTTQEALTWADGRAHARIAFETGRASFGLLYGDPKLAVPRHRHADSVEVVGLLSGEGTMGLGEEDRAVSGGDVFHVSAGQPHDFRPAGRADLVAVQLYLPPGPEQRFKTMGAAGATGELDSRAR